MGGRGGSALTVAQLLPALDGGGVERGTLEIAGALQRAGHRSLVISAGGLHLPQLLATGTRHVPWPVGCKSPLTLRWVGRLRRLLAREGVDILHARSRLPAWIAWLAWRGMPAAQRPRFVTTVHGLYRPGAYSAVMARGERVIAVSNHARDHVLTNWPATDPARIRVIPRGVDTRAYHPGYRPSERWLADWYREFPAARGAFLVTLPGRVTRRKGALAFPAVIGALRAGGVPAHGVLAGDLPDDRRHRLRGELARAVDAAGVRGHLSLAGHRADLREVLAVSSAVVSLAEYPEAFGRTVNEALALGRPVAGYAHGGVGEQLAAAFPQGAIRPGDRAALVDRLLEWSGHAPALDGVRPCTLDDMLRDTLQLYAELAGDGRR